MELRTYLEQHNACDESLEWLGNRNVEQCINECERGDWLLWLERSLVILDKRGRVRIGAMCADTVKHLTDDKRIYDCIDVCYSYAAGECTEDKLYAAASAAERSANQKQTADIVRRELGQQLINKLHELGVK